MKKSLLPIFTLVFILASCREQNEDFELASIINSNMVLQQHSTARFWGKAAPGVAVHVAPSWGEQTTAIAGRDSVWIAEYDVPIASNSGYSIRFFNNKKSILITNIAVGEVWLAVGQGNLAKTIAKDFAEIQYADTIPVITDSLLRFYNIDANFSTNPAVNTRGNWVVSSPNAESIISATQYYFARHLRDSLDVPIGIINAASSGTTCEAWMDREEILTDTTWYEMFKNVDRLSDEFSAYEKWLSKFPSISTNRLPNGRDPIETKTVGDEIVPQFELNFNSWDVVHVPTLFKRTNFDSFDGMWWFVRRVAIPNSWIDKPLTLYLGKIDDRDFTYVNGVLVGSYSESGQYDVARIYNIPRELTRSGYLNLAIRVVDSQNDGGFYGIEGGMRIEDESGQSISIEGQWRFRAVAQFFSDRLYIFAINNNDYAHHPELTIPYNGTTPTIAYNGMIAPIKNYNICGIIYQQGETNSANPGQFESLLVGMANSMRRNFRNPKLPILLVQLAPPDFSDPYDIRCGAKLREAQRRACAAVDRMYLVSLMDIGNTKIRTSVPKRIVGQRIAMSALANFYHFDSALHHFINIKNFSTHNNLFIINLENAENMNVSNSISSSFEVADVDSVYYPASITVSENQLRIFSHMVSHPVMARYAFCDTIIGNITNSYGIPLSSFSSEVNPYTFVIDNQKDK